MSSYVISCCSTADLTEEHFSKREISYICFHYKLNDTEYADDLGKSMPFDQFYAAMAAGAAVGAALGNKCLAPKRHASGSAVAAAHVNAADIGEL